MTKSLLSRARYLEFNSSLIRTGFKAIYRKGRTYTVPFGALRGAKLVYDPDINIHMMLGVWEVQNMHIWRSILKSMSHTDQPIVICDVGANVGFMSLWFSRYSGSGGQVFAFEPAPDTFKMLSNNLHANHTSNVTALPYACADQCGTLEFYIGVHHHQSSIDAAWASGGSSDFVDHPVSVKSVTLDSLFYDSGSQYIPPSLIKMDIEGGATLALRGCKRLGAEKRPLFVIESHTPAEDRGISDFMLEFDYQAYRINTSEWVVDRADTYPNLRGVWGTLIVCPSEKRQAITAIL